MRTSFVLELHREWSEFADESYKRGCQEKILPLSSPRGDGWWLASSRISVLERLWAGRVFRTDRAVGGLYSTVS
jgi:hypothetical protein